MATTPRATITVDRDLLIDGIVNLIGSMTPEGAEAVIGGLEHVTTTLRAHVERRRAAAAIIADGGPNVAKAKPAKKRRG